MLYYLLVICIATLSLANEDRPEGGVFQYQSSFRGPYGGTHIPFWETGGSALVLDNYVRLTPAEQSKKGWIWSSRPIRHRDFEFQASVSIGSESRLGADGMGIWYTRDRATEGPVYGSSASWNGLLIALDTFDNDGQRDNPVIYAVYNDKSFEFSPSQDGKDRALGSCMVAFRQMTNNPESHVAKVKVTYRNRQLSLYYDLSDLNNGQEGWQHCFTSPLEIPDQHLGYFMGISAETGGLSDYHDVKSFTTWVLIDNNQAQPKENKKASFLEKLQQQQQISQQQQQQQFQSNGDVDSNEYVKRNIDGPVSNSQVLSELNTLNNRETISTNAINEKIRHLEEKLQAIERSQFEAINRIESTLNLLTQRSSSGQVEDLKRDVKSAINTLTLVQTQITSIQSQVEGANKKTAELHQLHHDRTNQIKASVEQSSSFGFWTYFLIFQIFFVVAFFIWKRGSSKSAKFLD
eukprot:TRINITY_DN8136_c0_g1_i1.p1 TRINITY_DN8136_c0_g1~~TRINITY_DN8136_c0_g1_i1.p1  ORF type:complete len:463 (-),score=81.88 TRINITY_DN8136_c0_g1_i1:174-1562(-)